MCGHRCVDRRVPRINQFTALIWGIDARALPSLFPNEADDFVRMFGALCPGRLGTILVLIMVVVL